MFRFKEWRPEPHPRESEIVSLPRQISMNTPKPVDRTVPTFETPKTRTPIHGKVGRPRTRPVMSTTPKVRLSELIIADSALSPREIADKHSADISYVRKVLNKNGRAPSRPAPIARPDSYYLSFLAEHEAGATRKVLKQRHSMTDQQVAYCLLKGKRIREAV